MSSLDFQWEEFPFQLQFLSLYAGNQPDNLDAWEARLGETISTSRGRFLYYGLIEELVKSPADIIRASSLEMLRGWAKDAGIRVSGKKSEVAERIISAQTPTAFEFADFLLKGLETAYELTDTGKALCERFLSHSPWAYSDDWYDGNNSTHVRVKIDVQRQFESRHAEMLDAGIRFIEVLGSGNPGKDCQACLEMKGREVPINSISLPLSLCDRAQCTCVAIARS